MKRADIRFFNTRADGNPFDEAMIEAVWRKGTPESDQEVFRRDECDAIMYRHSYGKREHWGWEIDHIKPVSLGGTDELSNLRPLQWENNRAKGDSYPDTTWICKVKS